MSYNPKTNWQDSEIVHAADMNRIEQGIKDVDENKQDKILTDYEKAEIEEAVIETDSVPEAIGKLDKGLENRAKKDMSNIENADFLQKAIDSGVVSDVIPNNKTRYRIFVSSYDGLNISGRILNVSKGGTVIIGTTKSNGEALIEVDSDGEWLISFDLDDVPQTYSPTSQTVAGVYGEEQTVFLYLQPFLIKTLGIKIDEYNSNPLSAVTYTNDATGYTPSSMSTDPALQFIEGSWADEFPFNEIKPCLFKDGEVVGYLKPDNFSQFLDGSPADITSGTDGDVMIEFPKMFLKFNATGIPEHIGYLYNLIDISNSPQTGYSAYPFSYKGQESTKFYIGAYLGYSSGGKLRSLSGKTPTVELTRNAFRTLAQTNGDGYEIMPYNKLVLLQALYLLRFKNLDSQTALGNGYVGMGGIRATGTTNDKGMYYGRPDLSNEAVKCFGIEDLWGNIFQYIDGIHAYGFSVYEKDGYFNDTPEEGNKIMEHDFENDYAEPENIPSTTYSGFMRRIVGENKSGFLLSVPTQINFGSSSTYYCDLQTIILENANYTTPKYYVCGFGDFYSGNTNAGAFRLSLSRELATSSGAWGARLCYCK